LIEDQGQTDHVKVGVRVWELGIGFMLELGLTLTSDLQSKESYRQTYTHAKG